MKKTRNIQKRLVYCSIFVLMLSLAACSSEKEHLSYDTIKILQGGTYYYQGLFYDGSDLDGYTIEMAVEGKDFVIAFSDKKGDEFARSVGLDGKGYYVDTTAKKYTRDTYYDDVNFSYNGLKFLESGSGMIKKLAGIQDKKMAYEKYQTSYGDETGTIQFYFDNDKLYAIQEDYVDFKGKSISEVVVVKKISSDIPTGWFGIPEGFKKAD